MKYRSSELIWLGRILYHLIQVTHCVHGFSCQSVLKFGSCGKKKQIRLFLHLASMKEKQKPLILTIKNFATVFEQSSLTLICLF